jgi:hypothetical protein
MNLLEHIHQTKYADLRMLTFCKTVAQVLGISPVSVFRFYRYNNLPAQRKIELVKAYKLNPNLLIK